MKKFLEIHEWPDNPDDGPDEKKKCPHCGNDM